VLQCHSSTSEARLMRDFPTARPDPRGHDNSTHAHPCSLWHTTVSTGAGNLNCGSCSGWTLYFYFYFYLFLFFFSCIHSTTGITSFVSIFSPRMMLEIPLPRPKLGLRASVCRHTDFQSVAHGIRLRHAIFFFPSSTVN